jgi:hypothetical protein
MPPRKPGRPGHPEGCPSGKKSKEVKSEKLKVKRKK